MSEGVRKIREKAPDWKQGDTLGTYMARKPKPKLAPATLYTPRKLDIGCGNRKQPGFKGIDLAGDADITWDLFQFPWPIKTSSVSEAHCQHFVEHIPHYRPEFGGQDGWWLFWGEVYRIMRKNGPVRVVHPYAMHARAFWDPTHERYIHEGTWAYLDRGWRERELIGHYGADVDFEIVTINGMGIPDAVATRNQEYQDHARNHFWNTIEDLEVVLRCRK